MYIEEIKKAIVILVETSKDIDYIVALYSFASSYPDNSKIQKSNLD